MPEIELPDEPGLSLLRVIAKQIASGAIRKDEPETFLTSAQALTLLGKPGPWQNAGWALRHNGLVSLEDWTSRHDGLPKVTALIVYKQSHRPRAGFLKSSGHESNPEGLAWWRKEANRSIDFDWTRWVGIVRYKRVSGDFHDLRARGDQRLGRIDVSTVPARLRTVGMTVGNILRRLAQGESEAEILRDHAGLKRDDIRASLVYAAEREEKTTAAETKMSSLSTLASRWQGKFTLPRSAPDDPRLDYLVRKYWRNRE